VGKIGGWLQVGANVGILAGLILVGLQMQQNERLFKIQLVNQFNQSQATLETAVGGEDLATTWAKAVERPGELTLAEMRALEAVLYAPLIQWINLYRLHESGITDENEWKSEVNANAGYFYGSAYGRAWWEMMSEIFEPPFLPKELEAHIEIIVGGQSPNANAGMYEAIKRRAIEIQDAPLNP
jgi:hypothetical protein